MSSSTSLLQNARIALCQVMVFGTDKVANIKKASDTITKAVLECRDKKLDIAIRDLFNNNINKRTSGITDVSKIILEEHITHMIQWVLSDIQLMRSTSSFFVVDLKEKVNKVCDYIYSIENAKH
jgi:hypothetical protein